MNIVGVLVGLALVSGVVGLLSVAVILCFLLYGARRAYYALSGKTYVPLLEAGGAKYEHQDVNAGASIDSIRTVLKRHLSTKGVNTYARAGLNSLESSERKATAFLNMLDSKFEPGSITWQKFAGAADATRQAVIRNCADLANAIQLFDYEDYRRTERTRRMATYRKSIDGTMDQTTQIEKQHLHNKQLADMQAIIDRNDKLLLELDKFTAELGTLNDSGSSAESDKLIEEIQQLAAETKYYKDALDNM